MRAEFVCRVPKGFKRVSLDGIELSKEGEEELPLWWDSSEHWIDENGYYHGYLRAIGRCDDSVGDDIYFDSSDIEELKTRKVSWCQIFVYESEKGECSCGLADDIHFYIEGDECETVEIPVSEKVSVEYAAE